MNIVKFVRAASLALGFASVSVFANEEHGEGWDELIYLGGGVWNDTGNFAAVEGDLPPIFWENRLSNGPVTSDYFAENLGFELTPSLHPLGPSQGNNYSMIDSWAGKNGPYDLSAMVTAYLDSKNGVVSDKTLHVLWTGGHDVLEMIVAPGDIDYSQLDAAVAGAEDALYRLIDAGAEHIFAPTYADVGVTPGFIRAGLSDRATTIAQYYNRNFRRMLTRVEYHTGQRIYRFDFDKYIAHLAKNYAFFGFENGTVPCLEAGDACDGDNYLFYTQAFINSRAHKMVGDAFYQDLLQQVSSCSKGNWHPKAHWWVCNDEDDRRWRHRHHRSHR